MAGLFSFFKKKNKDDVKQATEDLVKSVDTQDTSNEQTVASTDTQKNVDTQTVEVKTVAQETVTPITVKTQSTADDENTQKTTESRESIEDIEPIKEVKAENAVNIQQEAIANTTQDEVTQTTIVQPIVKEKKSSFFERLRKTRENIAFGLSALIKGRKIDEDLYEELETALLTADLGVDTTNKVIERLRQEAKLRELHDASLLKNKLNEILIDILKPCQVPLDITQHSPFVILMVGVNGAGKTTTIGKLAQKYKAQGLKVMLAAGDTFRAAAVEQLKEWGQRVDVPVVAQATGSDSASVLFDALNSAKAKNMDVLICDTAGRLQNKDNLMDELSKIVRVMKKIDENVPHEVMLVLDGTTGQNAMSQATIFSKAVNVSGLCLTKLDGSAKGGVIFALADKFKLPIRYVGVGEKASDLREFSTEDFVKALTDID